MLQATPNAKLLADPAYTPHRLINETAWTLKTRTEEQLAWKLCYDHGALSRVRHKKMAVPANLMIKIMDRTGWTLEYVRELAGMPFIEGEE